MAEERISSEDDIGLVILQKEDQQHLVKYLSLILSYLYGFNLQVVLSAAEAAELLQKHGQRVRCTFLVQDHGINSETALAALGLRGKIPLFLVLPEALIEEQAALYAEAKNTYFCALEQATENHAPRSLRALIDEAFAQNKIGGVFDGARYISFRVLQQRVQRRLKHLNTLPTLPEVVLRIMKVIGDQESTADDLEEVLLSDSAVVHKLIQVVNAPIFAGSAHRGDWSLRDAIVRLGRQKIGSIAVQIKLINSLVKPEDSGFDLQRFWVHSVGCAQIADRIVADKAVDIEDWEACHNYWVAALLHDVGKMILGFFFWGYFEQILAHMESREATFKQAESRLSAGVTHEQVGQLLLLRANLPRDVVQAVSAHHQPPSPPPPLASLVHLADNLCKDLGMGYLPDERGDYSDSVLRALNLGEVGLDRLRDKYRGSMKEEIEDLFERCTQG